LRKESSSLEHFVKIKKIGVENEIENEELNQLLSDSGYSNPVLKNEQNLIQSHDQTGNDWGQTTVGIDVSTSEGFQELIQRFRESLENEDNYEWRIRGLLNHIADQLKYDDFKNYIFNLIDFDIDLYTAQVLLIKFSKKWAKKASFKRVFSEVLYRFGEKYCNELSNVNRGYVLDDLAIGHDLTDQLVKGIFSGLINSSEINDPSVFFGFVKLASSLIEASEAIKLVDFSFNAFESQMNKDFGDGAWQEGLKVYDGIENNIGGFIWSALGSPVASERWQACHVVRVLGDLQCQKIIDSLLVWLNDEEVEAFGYSKYPFYKFHATQYLMMSLVKVSTTYPNLLVKAKDTFLDYALNLEHIIIQRLASKVIINIENEFPNSYSSDVIQKVAQIGNFNATFEEKPYDYVTDSYWHLNGKVDTTIKYNSGWDFKAYWFEPLGEIFGVSGDQVQEIANEVIVNEWKLGIANGYDNDPRVLTWNRYDRNVEQYKTSYPKTDRLDFYLSYHSLLVIASRLIKKMPVIVRNDYRDNPWKDWISNHFQELLDTEWLADIRTEVPIKRPKWIEEKSSDNWVDSIPNEVFLTSLLHQDKKDDTWINIKGNWYEKDGERKESYGVSCALVSKETSTSLMIALETCKDSYLYKLPEIGEERMEINNENFRLEPFVGVHNYSYDIQRFDPFAKEIQNPGLYIHREIMKELVTKESILSKVWSSGIKDASREVPNQHGVCLTVDLSSLRSLCSKLNSNIVFEVIIQRDDKNWEEGKREYGDRNHRIFILTENGELKSLQGNYQLG
jgi:hypothetical protein